MVPTLDPEDMVQTPAPGHGEAFGVLDALVMVSPFVFLLGTLTGIAAALLVWPVAARLGDPRGPLERDPARYLRGPIVIGGLGLVASVVVDFARKMPPEQVGPALGGRLLLFSCCLAVLAHRVQYRDATPERRRANGYAYAGFVVVWTAFALGLYALLI